MCDAATALIDDSFFRCFASAPPDNWNFNWCVLSSVWYMTIAAYVGCTPGCTCSAAGLTGFGRADDQEVGMSLLYSYNGHRKKPCRGKILILAAAGRDRHPCSRAFLSIESLLQVLVSCMVYRICLAAPRDVPAETPPNFPRHDILFCNVLPSRAGDEGDNHSSRTLPIDRADLQLTLKMPSVYIGCVNSASCRGALVALSQPVLVLLEGMLVCIKALQGPADLLIVQDTPRRRLWERSLVQYMANGWLAAWSGVIKYHGPRPMPRPGCIWVANHSSMIDYTILTAYMPFAAIMQLQPGWVGFLQKRVLSCLGCLWFHRTEVRS